VERGEFVLHYQPIVALGGNQLIGLEALVRWQHPDGCVVSPNEFIPVAEETGLIIALGEWILREACTQVRQWHKAFPSFRHLTLSVNLSGRQLVYPRITEQIEHILSETGFDAACLRLEITESILIENTRIASETLAKLCALGVQLQMDDFGTGYSSLSYLHRFPIHTLKIDRAFIQGVGTGGQGDAIVQAIITLAHNLNMHVVAEGVEAASEVEHLRMIHCEYGQGYYFAPPLLAREVERLLMERHDASQHSLHRPFRAPGRHAQRSDIAIPSARVRD
jgi:EAL domain-containing protein (putative c-di-GMP-specific phosphodiesterase class I)